MAGESKGKEKDASAKEKRRKHRRHESKDNEASSLNENPEAPKEKTHKKHHKRNSNSNSKASPPSSPMTSPISTPNGSPEREKSPMNKRTSKSDDKGKGKQKEKEKDGEKKEEKQQNVVAENEGGSGTLRGRRKKGSSSRQLRSSNSTDNLNRISKTAKDRLRNSASSTLLRGNSVTTFSRKKERDSLKGQSKNPKIMQLIIMREKWKSAKGAKDLTLDAIRLFMGDMQDDDASDSNYEWKCNSCSSVLFKQASVVAHSEKDCSEMVFILPQDWMLERMNQRTADLSCEKCSACLGFFSWDGTGCSCGAKIDWPSFVILRRSVDCENSKEQAKSIKYLLDKTYLTIPPMKVVRRRSMSAPGTRHSALKKSRRSGIFQNILDKSTDTNSRSRRDETFYASCWDELPQDCIDLLKKAKISKDDANEHFTEIRRVLRFQTKADIRHPREKTEGKEEFVYEDFPMPSDTKEQLEMDFSLSVECPEYISEMTDKLISKDNAKDYYKLIDRAGRGGFGRVFVAKDFGKEKKNMSKRCAVKRIPHSTKKEMRTNLREISILSQLDHGHIVTYFRSHIQDEECWMMMEYMEGGTLDDAMVNHKFAEPEIAYVARECLKALRYLHVRRLVHRDIKPSNIMLTTDGIVKLIDFGLCEEMKHTIRRPRTVGSPYWMAPEVMMKRPYGGKCDVFSLAICLCQMANGQTPFKNGTRAMFEYCTKGVVKPLSTPSVWSSEFKDFLQMALVVKPEDRASTTKLLKHEWLNKAVSQKTMRKVLSSIFLTSVVGQLGGF